MHTLTAPSASTEPGPIALCAGQTLWLLLRRGDALVAASAGITLTEAPLWLAERWLERPVRLDAEARHVIERGGWARVQSDRPARLSLLVGPPGGAWWRTLTARTRWRRTGPPRRPATR